MRLSIAMRVNGCIKASDIQRRHYDLVLCVEFGRVFFFFQAEDGIRDWSVTGVQTCALPILAARPRVLARLAAAREGLRLVLVQDSSLAWQDRNGGRGGLSLSRRIDPHAPRPDRKSVV